MTKDEIYKKYMDKNGIAVQTLVLAEEMGELIQVLSKFVREPYCWEYNHLAEELADVEICLEQVKRYHGITEKEVEDWKIKKLERMEKRLNVCVKSDSGDGGSHPEELETVQ